MKGLEAKGRLWKIHRCICIVFIQKPQARVHFTKMYYLFQQMLFFKLSEFKLFLNIISEYV